MDTIEYKDEYGYEMDHRAWGEMMSDIFHRAINTLNKTEKKVIRHMHELRLAMDRLDTYKKKNRKELAKELGIQPLEVLKIRMTAIKKIKDFIENPEI